MDKAALVEKYSGLIYKLSARRPTLEAREDLAQDLFVVLLTCADRIDPTKGTADHYIVKSLCSAAKEKFSRGFTLPIEDIPPGMLSVAPKIDFSEVDLQSVLTDQERELLEVKLLGYTGKECAKLLGCSYRQVRYRLKKIKCELAKLL